MLRIISDYENLIYTSTVCVREFIHLGQTGKFKTKHKNMANLISDIEAAGVEIRTVGRKHMEVFVRLPMKGNHRDPNDRMIIAQAIADRIPLISCDSKFPEYESEGLNLVFNSR